MPSESRITYVGSFPPPYGGVTVKNALLYKHLALRVDIDKLDLSRVKRLEPMCLLSLVRCLVSRKGTLVIGVSADWRRRITCFLYRFNRAKLRRSLLFVMGGKIPDDRAYVAKLGCYRRVYVETDSMRRAFEAMGADNVAVYPNCRERPAEPVKVRKCGGGV